MTHPAKRVLLFFACLTFAGIALAAPADEPSQPIASPTATQPPLPRDAARAIKRAEICHYLAGELSGDSSARDKEVNDALRHNKCIVANAELLRLKAKYKNQVLVVTRIEAVE